MQIKVIGSKLSAKFIPFLIIFILIEFLFFLSVSQNKITNTPNFPLVAEGYVKSCAGKTDWRTCYGEKLTKEVKKHNIKYATKVIESIQAIDKKTRDCHILAHYTSSAAINKNPKDWKSVIRQINPSACNYGYVHGMFEALVKYDPKFKITTENIPNLCNILKEYSGQQDTDLGCAHIMGHLLLAENVSPTIEEGIKKTVLNCSQIPGVLRHECYAGAFMESFTRDNVAIHWGIEHIKWWTKDAIDDQENICNQYSGSATAGCWQEISHMYNAYMPNNPKAVFDMCQNAPTKSDKMYCYLHAVNTLVLNQNADKNYYASICEPLKDDKEYYSRCYRSATYSMIYASTKFSERAIEVCKSLPSSYQNNCLGGLTQLLQRKLSIEEKRNICGKLPKNYQSTCNGQRKVLG